MNVAILGGCFDPPHIWHHWICLQVLEFVKSLDQIWLAPDYKNAFKSMQASPKDRLEMLKYHKTDKIKVCKMAIDSKSTTYTIDVLEKLQSSTKHSFSWIIGSDAVKNIHKWKDYKKLMKKHKFLVFPRFCNSLGKLPSNFTKISGNIISSNLSSSIIRKRVKNNLSIKGLVFPQVKKYILEKGLYK